MGVRREEDKKRSINKKRKKMHLSDFPHPLYQRNQEALKYLESKLKISKENG